MTFLRPPAEMSCLFFPSPHNAVFLMPFCHNLCYNIAVTQSATTPFISFSVFFLLDSLSVGLWADKSISSADRVLGDTWPVNTDQMVAVTVVPGPTFRLTLCASNSFLWLLLCRCSSPSPSLEYKHTCTYAHTHNQWHTNFLWHLSLSLSLSLSHTHTHTQRSSVTKLNVVRACFQRSKSDLMHCPCQFSALERLSALQTDSSLVRDYRI